jgi:hypothetical protein
LVVDGLSEYFLRYTLGPSFGSPAFIQWSAAESAVWWSEVQCHLQQSGPQAEAWKEQASQNLPGGAFESLAYQMVVRFMRAHPAMKTTEVFACRSADFAAMMNDGSGI